MVKIEKPSSSEDSDSSSDRPESPLAASTQKSPPPLLDPDESEDDEPSATQESIPKALKSVQDTKEKYLTKFPNVRPSKPKYSVDVDLTDPDDEVWIVRCPKTVDAKAALLNANLDGCQFGEASQIQSTRKDQQLEGLVTKNAAKKPVIVMSGTDFKSFVPVGTIQIREALGEETIPARLVKQEGRRKLVEEDVSVPFPEIIRDRHPMLGLNYKASLKLPKRVKKALSLAQQRADACYQQRDKEKDQDQLDGKAKRKRKRSTMDVASSSDEMIQMLIKREAQSVSPKKKKANKVKKEKQAVEDDLSWLHNI